MDTNQTNSNTVVIEVEKEHDPPLQDATKQSTFFQTFVRIYHRLSGAIWMTVTCISPALFIVLCFIPYLRIVVPIYVLWMYYDRRTPHTGGRRVQWCRTVNLFRCHRDYFPVRLIKTAELPPDTTYLFAAFPHGIWPFGMYTNFASDFTGFDKAFPGLTTHIHAINFLFNLFPIARDLFLFVGVCAVSKESILHVLNGPPGNVSVILVGGYQETMKSSPGSNQIVLKNRKGFVKLALKAGYVFIIYICAVPVYSFGEPDTYDHYKWHLRLQEKCQRVYRMGFLILGKGPCRFDHLFGIIPYRKPVTTVGSPIKLPKVEDPSDELVNKFHEIFVQELTALFEKYKGKYDSRGEEATLIIE